MGPAAWGRGSSDSIPTLRSSISRQPASLMIDRGQRQRLFQAIGDSVTYILVLQNCCPPARVSVRHAHISVKLYARVEC